MPTATPTCGNIREGNMFWNNRVIFHKEENPAHSYYAIHECFYDDGELVPHSWTENPIAIIGDNIEEIRETLDRMIRATERPILTEQDGNKLVEICEKSIT